MVVGKRFLWIHFPKCAGHTVNDALKIALRGDADVSFDAQGHEGWHDTPAGRRLRAPDADLDGRVVISGFRRLPFWLLSRIHYEASRPPYLSATREMLCRGEFYEQSGLIAKADDYAVQFDSAVDRWIRMEHLAEDFERHFGDILAAHALRAAVRKLRKIVNGTRLNYLRSLDFYFTPENLAALYDANPIWAERERRLYGDILTLPDRTNEGMYFTDRKLQFVAANPTALGFWGKSINDILGRHMLDVFPLAKQSEPYLAHYEALRTMKALELATVSPTLQRPVHLKFQPSRVGLKVLFDIEEPARASCRS